MVDDMAETMKKTENRNETMKQAKNPKEIFHQDVDEVTGQEVECGGPGRSNMNETANEVTCQGVECGGPGRSNMNETANETSGKLSDMHIRDEDRSNELKTMPVKAKETLIGAKDRVLGAFKWKSKEGGGRSWGQWASDGLKYLKDKVFGGSSVSEDEKGFAGKVKDHITEALGTVITSFRTGMPIGETEVLAENEPPSDITDDIKRGVSGICSAVSDKAAGMAHGLKEALTFDIGSRNNDSKKKTEEEHRN